MNLSPFTVRAPGPKTTQNTVDQKTTVPDIARAKRDDYATLKATNAVQPSMASFASSYPEMLSLNPANPVVPRRIDSGNTNLTSPVIGYVSPRLNQRGQR